MGSLPGRVDHAYEVFPHDADMGVRGFGADPAEAFANAALAMASVITDPGLVGDRVVVQVACEGRDLELLLVDWLNEVIYAMATRGLLFCRFEVDLRRSGDAWTLAGRLHGEPIDPPRHQPAVEVKGATFTALRVESNEGRWSAQCIVDV